MRCTGGIWLRYRQLLGTLGSLQRNASGEASTKQPMTRREMIAERRAQALAHVAAMNNRPVNVQDETVVGSSQQDVEKEKKDRWMEQEQKELMEEASAMTLALYRRCQRSVNVLRPGNDTDEQEFQRLEKEQKETEAGGEISMSPPVDRENELESRAAYYYSWTRENFQQESDCLETNNPWREGDTDRYAHFLKTGEERRQWVLRDYNFEDPYKDAFDHERLSRFQERAENLISEIYKARGWMRLAEVEAATDSSGEDEFFADETFRNH